VVYSYGEGGEGKVRYSYGEGDSLLVVPCLGGSIVIASSICTVWCTCATPYILSLFSLAPLHLIMISLSSVGTGGGPSAPVTQMERSYDRRDTSTQVYILLGSTVCMQHTH